MADDDADRRKRRSEDPVEAVDLQLEAAARDLQLEALVLADDVGRPLAQAGERSVTDVLASLAMWAEFNGGRVDELTLATLRTYDPTVDPGHVATHEVSVGGGAERLRLVALGRSLVRSMQLSRAASGVARIRSGAST